MSATVAHRSIWRPWPALVVHVGVVALTIAAAVVPALTGASQLAGLSRGATSLLQLGLPLSDIAPIPSVAVGEIVPLSSVAWMAVVPLYLIALHWSVVAAARRDGRDRTPALGAFVDPSASTPSPASPARPAPAVVATLALAVGAGAVCWAGWLAAPQAPRTALTYAGAIATALVLALALARITRSTIAPLAVSAGLWLAQTVWLFQQDSALWAFAALLALPVAAAVGALAATFSFATALTGERSPTPVPSPPVTGWIFSSELSSDRPGATAKTG